MIFLSHSFSFISQSLLQKKERSLGKRERETISMKVGKWEWVSELRNRNWEGDWAGNWERNWERNWIIWYSFLIHSHFISQKKKKEKREKSKHENEKVSELRNRNWEEDWAGNWERNWKRNWVVWYLSLTHSSSIPNQSLRKKGDLSEKEKREERKK